MERKKTSIFYFPNSCMEVWQAVTAGVKSEGFTFSPMSDEEYEAARQMSLKNGKVLAHVTDMTPGVRCAYTLNAGKFDVYWSADFSTVGDGECRMAMTERYAFHPGAGIQYLLSLLFLRQGQQHKDFRTEIETRLQHLTQA